MIRFRVLWLDRTGTVGAFTLSQAERLAGGELRQSDDVRDVWHTADGRVFVEQVRP